MTASSYATLDVRPLLKRGEEPFSAILAAVDALAPGAGLLLISPFLPSPLIEHLKAQGFSAQPARLSDGSWQTVFTPQAQ